MLRPTSTGSVTEAHTSKQLPGGLMINGKL